MDNIIEREWVILPRAVVAFSLVGGRAILDLIHEMLPNVDDIYSKFRRGHPLNFNTPMTIFLQFI